METDIGVGEHPRNLRDDALDRLDELASEGGAAPSCLATAAPRDLPVADHARTLGLDVPVPVPALDARARAWASVPEEPRPTKSNSWQ